MKKVFKSDRTFGAYYDAEKFIKEQGLFYGSMECDRPIGIAKEDWVCCKWRHITTAGKQALTGVIISKDFREGDVTVVIFDDVDTLQSSLK